MSKPWVRITNSLTDKKDQINQEYVACCLCTEASSVEREGTQDDEVENFSGIGKAQCPSRVNCESRFPLHVHINIYSLMISAIFCSHRRNTREQT
jgi:hypothetical protein